MVKYISVDDLRAATTKRNQIWNTITDASGRGLDEIIDSLPSAQPERLTDDDFETIRIHLNAYKEKLCNQHRWKEADEYQRIIDKFIAFASAQPLLRCKDCKYYYYADNRIPSERGWTCANDGSCISPNDYCSWGERIDG